MHRTKKMLWGGDCHFIEETICLLEFGEQTICEVFAKRIEDDQINEDIAKKIICEIFIKNASKLHQFIE